jgi:hypothetical protein
MGSRYVVGRAPEEPDTCLIGKDGVFFARVVGLPDRPAEPIAKLFAAAPDLLAVCQDIEIALADTKFASSPLYKQMLAAIEKAVGDQ